MHGTVTFSRHVPLQLLPILRSRNTPHRPFAIEGPPQGYRRNSVHNSIGETTFRLQSTFTSCGVNQGAPCSLSAASGARPRSHSRFARLLGCCARTLESLAHLGPCVRAFWQLHDDELTKRVDFGHARMRGYCKGDQMRTRLERRRVGLGVTPCSLCLHPVPFVFPLPTPCSLCRHPVPFAFPSPTPCSLDLHPVPFLFPLPTPCSLSLPFVFSLPFLLPAPAQGFR